MDKRERDTMKKKNLQRKQRLLAVVLSVMLFAGLLPGSLSQVLAASDEYEDCCTVEVAGDEPDGIYESETLKADQSLAFSEETVKLEYGATAYGQVANAVENQDAADGKGYGTGAVTYRLTDNVLGAQINEKSGTLTFSDGKTGSVTVTAKKEADECYNECEASYTLVITYMQAPDVTYRLQGPQNSVNEDGTALPFSYHGDSTAAWFTDTVTIQAPDGYLISRTNSLSSRNWSASISCTEEGHNEISYYLRNRKSGGITDVLTIYDLKIDKGNPTDLQMEYLIEEAPAAWKDSVLYGKDEIAVRLTAKDTMSGLKGLYYQYKSNVISTSSQGKDWTKVDMVGTPAVIDKDFASAKLAELLNADMLIILTAVEKVAINFGKHDQQWLSDLTPELARQYIAEGQFAPGSMLPKVQAALSFAESAPGRVALITLLEKAKDGIEGKTGTRVHL